MKTLKDTCSYLLCIRSLQGVFIQFGPSIHIKGPPEVQLPSVSPVSPTGKGRSRGGAQGGLHCILTPAN